VNGAHAGQDSPVAYGNVARYLGVVADDAIVANKTIVCQVAVRHDKAVLTNPGRPPVLASAVDGNKFPDGGIVADFDRGLFAFVFQVLRNGGNYGAGKDAAVLADAGAFHDGNVATDPGAFADLYILMNHTEWINLYIGGQLRVGVNVRVWMDHLPWIRLQAESNLKVIKIKYNQKAPLWGVGH